MPYNQEEKYVLFIKICETFQAKTKVRSVANSIAIGNSRTKINFSRIMMQPL